MDKVYSVKSMYVNILKLKIKQSWSTSASKYSDLNEKCFHSLRHSNTWSIVGVAVWEVWEGWLYWKKSITELRIGFESLIPQSTPFAPSATCLWIKRLALNTLLQPPCHCLLPLFLAMTDSYPSGTLSSVNCLGCGILSQQWKHQARSWFQRVSYSCEQTWPCHFWRNVVDCGTVDCFTKQFNAIK